MFKAARWKSDKNKIKVVFRLQFQATQVPQLGWDTLMVTLIPVDVGKPTVRSEKALVRDETCRWGTPIYEAVKFNQDAKSGKFTEKIYKIIVSSGSSKSGILGEATFDFSKYAEAANYSSVSLPLRSSNAGAVLHVTIWRMHGDVDRREVDETETVTAKSQDGSLTKTTSLNVESNGNPVASRTGDASTSGSDSCSERNTPREMGLKNNYNHQDPISFLSSLSHSSMAQTPTSSTNTENHLEHRRTNTDWSVGSAPDGSIDSSTNGSEDNHLKDRSPLSSDAPVEKLKSDLAVLARQAEVSDLELQTLRKQIVKECKKGQDLSREVVSLKEERDALQRECQQLKAAERNIDNTKHASKLQFEGEDPATLLQEIRQELNYEKDLNANLRLQLQKTQESNSELILAVQDLDEILDKKEMEMAHLLSKSAAKENDEKIQGAVRKHGTDEDEEQEALEGIIKEHDDAKQAYLLEQKIIDLYSEIDVCRRDRDELEMQMEQLALDYEILKQENHDLLSKLEANQLQDSLKVQYDNPATLANVDELESLVENLEKKLENQGEEFSTSLAIISELESQVKILGKELKKQEEESLTSSATISELESQVKILGNELKKQEEESSISSATISELQTQIRSLDKELESQAEGFEADLEALTRAKVEQEQRAIQAEEALRKTRWTNANTAERLQEEFRRLSSQMASTFDANEKLAMKALAEANDLRMQKIQLEELLEKANEELGLVTDKYNVKLKGLSDQINLKTLQAEELSLELEIISKKLEDKKEHGEETHEACAKESQTLREEIEKLREEKNKLSKEEEQKEKLILEMEALKRTIHEMKLLVEATNVERDILEKSISAMRDEAEKSLDELNHMRSLKNEKEQKLGALQSELETLRSQYNDLKHLFFENELEKETLRKQVFHLKSDLQKKEDKLTSIERQNKESNGRTLSADRSRQRNNKSAPSSRGSKEAGAMLEKVKTLETQIKLKEAALEKSTSSFLEKEKDLCNKIEELEKRMEELSQNNTHLSKDQMQKESEDLDNIATTESINGGTDAAVNGFGSLKGTKTFVSNGNGIETKLIKSNNEEKESILSHSQNGLQCQLDKVSSEMELLKKRNKSMEGELKDMQERYSEISLKFAEVEGERQQLVMTVRNLKNTKKSSIFNSMRLGAE